MTPSLLRPLLVRAGSLLLVLVAVLVLLVVSLGATGFSERMLGAIVGEELRGLRGVRRPPSLLARALPRRGWLE